MEFTEITPADVQQSIRQFRNGGDVAEISEADIEANQNQFGLEVLSSGNWYARHPDKLLGDIVLDQNRYGREIKVVVGTIANLQRIDAPANFGQFEKSKNIAVSTSAATLDQQSDMPENDTLIAEIIAKSNAEIGIKAVKRKAKKVQFADETTINDYEKIQTYKEVYKSLNPAISKEELKAYIWYKAQIGQRLSEQWYDLADYASEVRTNDEMVSAWIREGILCYFNGELLPQVLYLSDNIYARIKRVVAAGENTGQDIQHILDNYGPQVLERQISMISNKYSELYAKRLILTGNEDGNSLIIKPISKLSRSFMVSSLQEHPEFKWWDKKGEPNWERVDGNDWHKIHFEHLSLTDAFCYWMLHEKSKLGIKGNITYNDIIYFYLDGRTRTCPPAFMGTSKEAEFKAELARTKSKAMAEGNRLFLVFLDSQLELNDRVRLETQWNTDNNNYLAPDYNKIPVAFNVTKDFGNESPFIVKPEKREAVAFVFNEGSGCLAYDVGVGKTMCEIMIMEQFLVAGYCQRPVVVVPNQTYKQWVSEIKSILPHRRINGLFNFGVDFLEETYDENQQPTAVPAGSITVITYEGLKAIGFNEETEEHLMGELYEILNQGDAEGVSKRSAGKDEKKKAGFREKLEMLIGRGQKGTVIPIEVLGLDFIALDEAHAVKKVFTSVKGDTGDDGKKEKSPYSIQSGMPSDTALKAFMLSQYVLRNNNYRNVVMLTATPFTNSPLEVFSMLSMLAYHRLKEYGINNIKDFFDTYIDASTELVINHKLQPQYKQIIKGFNNLPALQRLVLRFFNYKDGDDVGVVRPGKIVIPYTKKMVNNVVTDLSEDDKVTSYIQMNEIQRRYMADIVAYAEGKTDIEAAESFADFDDSEDSFTDSAAETLSEAALTSKEKSGVRALKAMNYSRNLALSPYLYKYHNLGAPTYKKYIETSPKLQYVIECIRSVKKYHESKGEPVSGQIIYMDRGVQYFPLIAEYLVKELGFKPHEIGMITSKGMSVDKKRMVQDQFLGRKYNEKTQQYEDISDGERLKVLIGSSSIKEGMNLQKKSTVLYNCFLDWNPTDLIQLQGRIWRQQNEFLWVRIVNPLMIDSIDIFMFQKLEEKTARINTIWSNDGKSVLKIEEVNPAEIKYALIKDPRVIASIEVDEKAIHLEDESKSNDAIKQRLNKYKDAVSSVRHHETEIAVLYNKYISDNTNTPLATQVKLLAAMYRQDKPKDKNGATMFSSWERSNNSRELREKYGEISPMDKPYKQYWFDGFVLSMRLVEKENKDLLTPRGIIVSEIDDYAMYIDQRNMEIAEEIKFLKSEDYVATRVQQILEFREKNKIEEKSVMQLVKEFERLNHLLSEKRVTPKAVAKEKPFERVNADGTIKTDAATLERLEQIVLNLPQTKALYTDANGAYTEERQKLHQKIIKEVRAGVRCITQDQPIAIFTGGAPASGKSTFLKTYAPYLLNEEIFSIDADEIRAMLPEYEGWNAPATHLETKDIINTLISDQTIGVPCKFDLIYDGTMNNTKNYLPLIGMLHNLGYKIFIVYMDNVPYGVVRERMIKRYEKTGRFVPMEVINDFYGKGKAALNELKTKVDGYIVVDASSKDYKIIERGGNPLPESRNYSEIQNDEQMSANIDTDDEVQEIISVIDGLEVLLTMADDEDKTEITNTIEGLKILLLMQQT